MTTTGEENYLRSSLLLLKGGTFTARKVVIREEQKEIRKSGRDLDDLLMDNKGRLEHEFRNYKHREKLFPADGKTKVEDWDISLLTGVLQVVFRSTLSEKERKAIRSIKHQRNDVYAHSATADLSADNYSDVCDELKEALRNLMSEFSGEIKTECEDIIDSCLNGPIDIKSHIEHLKRVSDTDNMFRTILEKIDKNGKETMEKIKEVVGQQHVSLKKDIAEDISNSQDVICRTVRDTQLTKADLRDAVQQALQQQEQRSTRKVKVVDSELEVSGKDVDKPNIDLAEQMIKTVTNEAIRRTQTSEELVDIREAIQEILDEIANRSGVKALEADIACVVIRFSYETYEQLLKLLEYLDSDDIKLRLAKLAALLSHHLQLKAQLHLSTSLSIKCLQNILDELETESRSEYKRTVRLPIQFESVEGMAHVWNYFENGGATNSLNKLSEALSAKLGTKIKLTSSLNVDQFKSALDDFGSENTSTRLTDQLRVGDDTTQSVDEDNQVSDTDNETASCADLTDMKSNGSQENIGGIELLSSISRLAASKLYELQNILDSNPDDTNWWALANVVHKKYNIRPDLIDGFKPDGSASSALLKHLQSQGMTVKELQDYLNEIGVKFCLEDELHGRKSSINIKKCHVEEGSEVRLEADSEDDGNARSKHQLLFSDIEKIEDMFDALQLADHYGVLIDNLETLDEVKKALYLHVQKEEGKKAVTSFPHVFKDATYRRRELRSIMTKFLDIIHKEQPYKIVSQLVEEMLKTDGTSENITDDCETNIDGQNCAIIFTGDDPFAGESSILNLVLGEDLIPLDDYFSSPCTVIRYSPQRSVRVVHAQGELDVLHDLDEEVIKRLRRTTCGLDHLELTLPHPILQSGVVLIDMPDLDFAWHSDLMQTLKQTAVLGLVYVSRIDSVGGIQEDRVHRLLDILDRPITSESDNYFHASFDPKSALFVFSLLDRIPKEDIDYVKVHAIGKLLEYWPSFEESQVVVCSMLKTHQDGNFEIQLLVKLNNLFTSAVQILTKQSYKWMEKVIIKTTHYLVTTVRLLNLAENDRRRECEVLERQLNSLKDKLSVFRKLKEKGNVVSKEMFVKLNEYIRAKHCEHILTQGWSMEEIPPFDSEFVTTWWPGIQMKIRKAFYDKLNECIEKWYIEERSISTFEEELHVTKNDLEKELKSIEKEMRSDIAHKMMELSESLLPPVPDRMSVLLHWKPEWGIKFVGRQIRSLTEIEMKISEYTADPLKFAETIAMEMYQEILHQFSQIESELIFSEGKRTGLQQIPLVEHFAKCFVEYIDALEERLLDIIMANCKLLNQLGGTAEEYRRDKRQYENMMWSMITLQNSLMEYNEKVSDSDICSGPKVIRFKSPTHIVTTINKTKEERDEGFQGHGVMSYVTANKEVGYSRDTKEVDFQWQKSSKIGEGRFGKVYSVVNVRRGELMTMKEKIFPSADEQYHINEIIDRVKILEGVNHPNLVKYCVEVHKPNVFEFMEYCDGGTIDQVSREGLTEDRIRVYTKELLTAVQVLHDNNIVHRDIKGTSIYITPSGCLKLGHLTSLKLRSQTTNEMDALVGTIAYMAPEVITHTCKEENITALDIWSIGCVVIEMATGKPPWHDLGNSFQIMFRVGTGETPPTPENLCDAGKDFLSHCLKQEPDKRWTASQLKDHPFAQVFSKCETTDEESDDDCDDVDDDYYDYNDDQDVEAQAEVKSETPEKGESDQEDERFFGGKTNPAAFQRLVKDLRNMKKDAHKFGIEGTPRGDNLFIWDVKLTGFPADTTLGRDIRNWAEKHKREPVVYLEMQFPDEYPMAPPFVRVTRPRFKFFSGHVTIGGSICMETLTKSGWTPTNDLQSILAEIRSEIMGDPNIRLDSNPDREYGEAEARDAFNRMVNRYDWNK